jgi:hypothetical protein
MNIILLWLSTSMLAGAQTRNIDPQIRTRPSMEGQVTRIELATHFVTAIRVPEAVNSVVVGDPDLFQVEHSEREPTLVFVKTLTTAHAETNLVITTARGRQISLLLTSRGQESSDPAKPASVDFLVRYSPAGGFLIEPEVVPFPLVGQTSSVSSVAQPVSARRTADQGLVRPVSTPLPVGPPFAESARGPNERGRASLDDLLVRQKQAPLPELFGQHVEGEDSKGERLRAGISEVLDHGQEVVVLFSIINTSKHPILLMPPQVQLGGKSKTGTIIKHDKWSTAEQLAILDYRLSERRVGVHERADGVVVFERPPYKQSNETLFLQMAESGAVDKPALAPIGFGVSSMREETRNAKR